MDVDEQTEIAEEVGIRAVSYPIWFICIAVTEILAIYAQMPTFKLFKDGEAVKDVVGASPKDLNVRILSSIVAIIYLTTF